MYKRFYKDLNYILKRLNDANGKTVSDETLIEYCDIDKENYFEYKSKLYNEKYIDAWKNGLCTITSRGKLFILNGGYKKEKPKWKTFDFYMNEIIKYVIGAIIGATIVYISHK